MTKIIAEEMPLDGVAPKVGKFYGMFIHIPDVKKFIENCHNTEAPEVFEVGIKIEDKEITMTMKEFISRIFSHCEESKK